MDFQQLRQSSRHTRIIRVKFLILIIRFAPATVCSGTEGPRTTGGTASGKKCCFPFVYETVSHSDCIVTGNRDDRPDGAWCPIADEYTPGTEWGYCSQEKPGTKKAKSEGFYLAAPCGVNFTHRGFNLTSHKIIYSMSSAVNTKKIYT